MKKLTALMTEASAFAEMSWPQVGEILASKRAPNWNNIFDRRVLEICDSRSCKNKLNLYGKFQDTSKKML